MLLFQMPADTNPNVAAKILKLVSDTLRFDKKNSAVVDDISLLNFQNKEQTSASSMVCRHHHQIRWSPAINEPSTS